MKEERNIMSKLLVITRTRPEIDISELFSQHEFSVVSRSLFDPFGVPWRCGDELNFLQELFSTEVTQNCVEANYLEAPRNVCILNGMFIINKLKLTASTLNMRDIAAQFIYRVKDITS